MVDAKVIPPDVLDPQTVDSRSVLIIGAPYIEKSKRASELAEAFGTTVTTNLRTAGEIPSDTPLIVDEFYRAAQHADADARETFRTRLVDGATATTCVFVRPRALDWLLDGDEAGGGTSVAIDRPVANPPALTESDIECFDDVVTLAYDPDAHEQAAIERCLDIGVDEDADMGDGLNELTLQTYLKEIEYNYEFDHDLLSETVGTYRSFVPPLVTYLSFEAGGEGLLADGVVNACKDLAANFTVGEFCGSVSDAALGLVSPEQIGAAGLSLATGPAVGAAISLALWLRFREGYGLDADSVFEVLGDGTITPTAKAKLEERLDLPPRTFENLEELSKEENLAEIRRLCEEAPERLDAFEAQVDLFERRADDHGERLDELESTMANLQASRNLSGRFFSAQLKRSTARIDDLAEALEADEATLLGDAVDEDRIDINDVEFYGSDDGETRIDQIVENVKSNRLVVLKGSHGTGKTTAAYKACQDLISRGYAVRLPNFRDNSTGFLRRALQGVDPGDERPLVLFASYGFGTGGARIAEQAHLEALFEWLDEGISSRVIIECRTELYSSLQAEATTGQMNVQTDLWGKEKEIISFMPFEQVQHALFVIKWVVELAQTECDIDKDTVKQIIKIGEGNPEITKIATRFGLLEDRSLSDIHTAEELVREDLQHLFAESEGDRGKTWELFKYLAVCGELRRSELQELLNANPSVLKKYDEVRGYLRREQLEHTQESTDERWRLSPDLYRTAIFRRCLEADGAAYTPFELILEDLFEGKSEYSHVAPKIAENFAVAYNVARSQQNQVFADTIFYLSKTFLEKVADEESRPLFVSIINMAFGEMPVPVSILEENVDRLIKESAVIADATEYEAAFISRNLLGSIIAHSDRGNHFSKRVANVAVQFELGYANKYDTDQFLPIVYSFALSKLVERYEPHEVQSRLDELTDRAVTTATDDNQHNLPPGQFLPNVYSIALRMIVDRYEPHEVQSWLNELTDRATTIDTHVDKNNILSGNLLSGVYTMTLMRLADRYEPHEVQSWLDELIDRAETNSSELEKHYNVPTGEFLEKIFGNSLASLSDSYEPHEVQSWLDELTDRAKSANAAAQHNFLPGEFLINVYSIAFTSLADDYEPHEVQSWLDELADRTTTAADHLEKQYNVPSRQVLVNVYSMTLGKIAKNYDPREVQSWLDEFTDRAATAASNAGQRNLTPGGFMSNFYGLAFVQLADRYEPHEVKSNGVQLWLDELTDRSTTAATDTGQHNLKPGGFISNVYSIAFSRLADRYEPREVQSWLDEFTDRAVTTAADADQYNLTTVQLLTNIYGMTLAKFSDYYGPREVKSNDVQTWLDEITDRAATVAHFEECCKAPSGQFLTLMFLTAISHVTPPSPNLESPWYSELLQRSLVTLAPNHVPMFYQSYPKFLLKIAVRSDEFSNSWFPRIVRDAKQRTLTADDPLTDDQSTNLKIVGIAAASFIIVLQQQLDTLDNSPGLETAGAIADVATESHSDFEVIISEATAEYEREAVAEAYKRRFLVRTYTAAIERTVDSNDENVPMAVYEAALERQSDCDESEEYLVELHIESLTAVGSRIPNNRPAFHDRLFESGLNEAGLSYDTLGAAYLNRLIEEDDYDPAWFAWLVVDVTTRDVPAEIVSRLTADAVHYLWKDVGTLTQSGTFDRIVDAIRPLSESDPNHFEAIVSGVHQRLENVHLNMIAALDWNEALNN